MANNGFLAEVTFKTVMFYSCIRTVTKWKIPEIEKSNLRITKLNPAKNPLPPLLHTTPTFSAHEKS